MSPLLGPGLHFLQARAVSSRAQAWAFEPSQALHITTPHLAIVPAQPLSQQVMGPEAMPLQLTI